MAVYFKQYTITATATSITTAMGLSKGNKPSGGLSARALIVKNDPSALNNVYLGASNVVNTPANAGIQLVAGQGVTLGSGVHNDIDTDLVFIVGTANAANIAYITLEA